MMNHRLTAAAGLATVCASLSLFAVLQGASWLIEGIGMVIVVALAGTLSRSATVTAGAGAGIAVAVAAMPLLVGYGWGGRIGWLALVALAGLSATGNRPARAFALLATYGAFLIIYLNAVFAAAESYARLIPSPASMTYLTGLPSQASPQFSYAPPIYATRPVDLVAVSGIGAIAIIVDFIAVRLRRPALAGLPLLLLFSVPVASDLHGFGFSQTIAFVLSLAGYLMLLSTDGRQRLRMWGRLVTVRRITGDESGGPDTKDLAATGRRIGLTAICLAIVVPLALPSSRPHDLFGGGRGGGTSLTSASGGESPLLGVQKLLAEKPRPELSYTSTFKDAGQEPYLQAYVLTYQPSSDSWQGVSSNPLATLQRPKLPYGVPGLVAGIPVTQVTTRLTIDDQEANAPVPLPYAPVRITGSNSRQLAEWPGTLSVFDLDNQSPLRLTAVSDDAEPTPDDLNILGTGLVPTSITNTYGGYKGPDVRQLRTIAENETQGASSWLDDAVDLQRWLTSSRFSYTLAPNLPRKNWLLTFLTTERKGYCQQFAWAFAVLARLLGIPSRIALGWTAGTQGSNGVWHVTSADAHAWPELYFPEVGWVRFEPTPGGADGQGTATAPAYTVGVSTGTGPSAGTQPGNTQPTKPGALPTTSPGAHLRGCGVLGPAQARPGPCADVAGGTGAAAAAARGFPVGIAIAIAIVLLLAAPGLGRWLTRRRRWLAASGDAALALAAWRELNDDLDDYDVATLPSDSPRTTVIRVTEAARLGPVPHAALVRIASAVERARYSPATESGARLRTDVAVVRKAIAASSSRGRRLRALLLPPSTMAAVVSGLQSASRATTWIDSSWTGASRQLRRAVLRRAS
jgi:transglutaminase-like putative cysteine protease